MYTARVIEHVEHHPGTWASLRIGIFQGDRQIGGYLRNYSSFYNTFFPFRQGERWYALYSKDYTATRLMELPSCRDLGGEESNAVGFCPTGYFVPTYIEYRAEGLDQPFRVNNPENAVPDARYALHTPFTYYPFGFVSGCVWGDDHSWKIQYLDLARASEGILIRDDRFGYIELPGSRYLAESIDMDGYSDAHPYITFALAKTYNGLTGVALDDN